MYQRPNIRTNVIQLLAEIDEEKLHDIGFLLVIFLFITVRAQLAKEKTDKLTFI